MRLFEDIFSRKSVMHSESPKCPMTFRNDSPPTTEIETFILLIVSITFRMNSQNSDQAAQAFESSTK